MLKYTVRLLNGEFYEIECLEVCAQEGLIIFRNASGQAKLAIPTVNVAYVKLDED